MAETMIKADKKLRTRFLIGLLAMACLCAALLLYLPGELREIRALAVSDQEKAAERIYWLTSVLGLANLVISGAIGAYLLSLAAKVRRAAQYPPPGVRLVKDVKIVSGKKAITWSRVLTATALVLFSTNIVFWYMLIILENLQME